MAIEGQGAGPNHIAEPDLAVEMRKQGPTARHFPFQVVAHGVSVAAKQCQTFNPSKVFGSGFRRLFGCRKVDEPVSDINWRAISCAICLQRGPFLGPEYLVDQHEGLMPRIARGIKPDFPL